MMIHPTGKAVFVEVPKTGSTACTKHLHAHGWFQNGGKGYATLPNTATGRHSYPTASTKAFLDEMGATSYGVVRNPFDRMASLWRASAPGNTGFHAYMISGKFRHGDMDILTQPQHTWLDNVDHVMRYEALEEQWDYWADRYGDLPLGSIPVINRSKNRAVPEWTSEEIDIVAQRFAVDIETYGYEGPS